MNVTLDAGGLIAWERGDRAARTRIALAEQISIPATALAQTWRSGARQAPLGRLIRLPHIEIVPLDEDYARAVGQLLALSGTRDIADAHVALVAGLRDRYVITSDPRDLERLDPRLELWVV